jgi:hypothetical protein
MTLKTGKPRLAILMPLVISIRNIVPSGLLDLLTDVDVHLQIPKYEPSLLKTNNGQAFSRAAGLWVLIPPPVKHRVKGLALLKDVINSAFSQRNSIGSYPIYQRWLKRNHTPMQRIRSGMVDILGSLAQAGPVFYGLNRLYERLFQSEYDLTPIRRQLQEINPDLLLSTVNVEDTFERAYVLTAKELGIPIVNSIVSFDNLTSKPSNLVYDYYLVWNQVMKEQLLRFYPQIKASQIYITGTPQFDFHRRPDCLWSRAKTLQQLGLPLQAQYFLYSGSGNKLTPAEPELVACLAEKMQNHDILKNYWLVIRNHPLDDWSRWESVKRISNRVMLSEPWEQAPDADRWGRFTIGDLARLTSSLAHASACINIASTMALDAAILDRPVIGIRFDKEPDAPHEILYEEYDTDHYRPLVESGGLRLAHTWDELLGLMQEALENPGRDRESRARMVAQECGLVDGNAVQRVADALLRYLEKIRE